MSDIPPPPNINLDDLINGHAITITKNAAIEIINSKPSLIEAGYIFFKILESMTSGTHGAALNKDERVDITNDDRFWVIVKLLRKKDWKIGSVVRKPMEETKEAVPEKINNPLYPDELYTQMNIPSPVEDEPISSPNKNYDNFSALPQTNNEPALNGEDAQASLEEFINALNQRVYSEELSPQTNISSSAPPITSTTITTTIADSAPYSVDISPSQTALNNMLWSPFSSSYSEDMSVLQIAHNSNTSALSPYSPNSGDVTLPLQTSLNSPLPFSFIYNS